MVNYNENVVIEMHMAMQEFVDNIDNGRSQKYNTYHKFRDILENLKPLPQKESHSRIVRF